MRKQNYNRSVRVSDAMKLEKLILIVTVACVLLGVPVGYALKARATQIQHDLDTRSKLQDQINSVQQQLDLKSHEVNVKTEDVQKLRDEKKDLEQKYNTLQQSKSKPLIQVAREEAQAVSTPPVAVLSGDHNDWLAQAGIAQSDWGYATYIINHENGLWCATRSFGERSCIGANVNVAYGICQANPGTKMVSAGADWRTNVITQLKWCNGYAKARYGGWYGAYQFWLKNNAW